MKTFYSDTGKGGTNWSMNAITDSSSLPKLGGLVLKDVQHDGHNFAKDVRLLAFLVFVDVLDGSGTLVNREYSRYLLASSVLKASAVQELRPMPVTNPYFGPIDLLSGAFDAGTFERFFRKGANQVGYCLRVDYTGTAGMFKQLANFEFDSIDLSQIFLFSHYGMSPPHEPGGVLTAARMHPMVKYEFHKNTSYDPTAEHRRLSSIRFDYRIQLYLDAFYNSTNAATDNGNNAGVFRDTASPPVFAGAAFLAGLADVSSVVFEAVEKPLVYEITGPGLAKSASAFPVGPVGAYMNNLPAVNACWDNVHWWGGGVGKNMISTPGAFHAAHLHWRWGEVAAGAPQGSQPQFGPGGVPSSVQGNFLGSYGVLVDPAIWIQSVRFAVALNDAKLDPDQSGVKIADLTPSDWKTVFSGLRAQPSDISSPSDIVLFYSIEVHRDVTVPSITVFTPPNYTSYPGGSFTAGTAGTVFIHGIFFAHEPEQTAKTIGTRSALYWPDSEKTIRSAHAWFRHA